MNKLTEYLMETNYFQNLIIPNIISILVGILVSLVAWYILNQIIKPRLKIALHIIKKEDYNKIEDGKFKYNISKDSNKEMEKMNFYVQDPILLIEFENNNPVSDIYQINIYSYIVFTYKDLNDSFRFRLNINNHPYLLSKKHNGLPESVLVSQVKTSKVKEFLKECNNILKEEEFHKECNSTLTEKNSKSNGKTSKNDPYKKTFRGLLDLINDNSKVLAEMTTKIQVAISCKHGFSGAEKMFFREYKIKVKKTNKSYIIWFT